MQNRVPMVHTQNKKQFFFKNNKIKPDPKLSKPFYFNKIPHMFWLSYVFRPRLFKSFEFGNGSRISEENLVILEFKYLQNKKW